MTARARTTRLALVGLALVAALLPSPSAAVGPGDPDSGFGGDGLLTTDFGGADGFTDLVRTASGRLVGVGTTTDGSSDLILARYRDGALDPSFGSGGRVVQDFGGGFERGEALAETADGRLVVVGTRGTMPFDPLDSDTDTEVLVARYLADGTLDPTFGTGGRVLTDLSGGLDAALDVVVHTDGRIVVTGARDGWTGDVNPGGGFVARYLPDGTLDPTFGTGGVAHVGDFPFQEPFTSLVASGGRYTLGATEWTGPRAQNGILLVRLLGDGSPDPAFGPEGMNQIDVFGSEDFADLVVQPGRGIVVAGTTTHLAPTPTDNDVLLARIVGDGDLDPTFGDGGLVARSVGDLDEPAEVDVLDDGKLVVGGFVHRRRDAGGGRFDMFAARFTADGAPDPLFGEGGLALVDRGSEETATAVEPDGGGVVLAGAAGSDGALARLRGGDDAPVGYCEVLADGAVLAHGDCGFSGTAITSPSGRELAAPIVGSAPTPTGRGYWFVASDGGVFALGDARFHGSMGGRPLNAPIVGMAATPTGRGYWLVASDGGIFAFGDAWFRGSAGAIALRRPIVGMDRTPTGNGYWLVASDGGIFAYGDAPFLGSTGAITLNQAIVGMAGHPTGVGYWLVASDGGVFTFGPAARFHGSTGNLRLASPVVGMAATPTGGGYWLMGADAGIFAFGDAPFAGSGGGQPQSAPAVAVIPAR